MNHVGLDQFIFINHLNYFKRCHYFDILTDVKQPNKVGMGEVILDGMDQTAKSPSCS